MRKHPAQTANIIRSVLLAVTLFVACSEHCLADGTIETFETTIVLCNADDPYLPLAEELAAQEGWPLVASIDAALSQRPSTLYWVAAPQSYSEASFSLWGRAIMDHDTPVCLGLISGKRIDSARALLEAEAHTDPLMVSIVPREGYLETWVDTGSSQQRQLDSRTLIGALADGGYVVYQGHGTRRDWRFHSDDRLTADDIPPLHGTVVNALACQTLKLWSDDAIALAFTDQGAAAYIGFLHSPQGYVIGEPKGFPAQYTWPDYDLGKLVQVQNRGMGQGHLAWPYYIILGDPHLSLASEPPYQVVSDVLRGDERTVMLSDAPTGVIPVRIEGGADYAFVASGSGAVAWRGDPFYDPDLQMIDIGDTKYLLLVHPGGDLEIALKRSVPLTVRLGEPLLDALDHLTVVQHATGSIVPNLLLTGLVWAAVGLIVWRKQRPLGKHLVPALWSGVIIALAQTIYALLRHDRLTALFTSYLRTQDVAFNISPLVVLSSLAIVVGGAWLLGAAKKPLPKMLAMLAATAPLSVIAPFWFCSNALLNLLAGKRYGVPLYGYAMGGMAAISWSIEALLLLVILRMCGWIARTQSRG